MRNYKKLLGVIFILNLLIGGLCNARDGVNNKIELMIKKHYGTKALINKNIIQPVSGDTLMSTMNGKSKFNVSDNNYEIEKKIKIVFKEDRIKISQDVDKDGLFGEYCYETSSIKGVKDNKIILKNDEVYCWDLKDNYIYLKKDSKNFENYILYNKLSNYDKIVGDIVSAILFYKKEAKININKNKNIFLLYIKRKKDFKNIKSDYSENNLQEYYNNQEELKLDINTVALKDGNNIDSMYYKTSFLNNIVLNKKKSIVEFNTLKECMVRNTPYVTKNKKIKIKHFNSCLKYIKNKNCKLQKQEICNFYGKKCIVKILNYYKVLSNDPLRCITIKNIKICEGKNSLKLINLDSNNKKNIFFYKNYGHFYVKNFYNCGKEKIDYSLEKNKNLFTSIRKNNNKILYKDFQNNNKKITIPGFKDCLIKYCAYKIKKTFNDKIGIKQCVKQYDDTYSCPLNKNEEIINNCSCELDTVNSLEGIKGILLLNEIVDDVNCLDN